jgi:DNA-binding transcriptional ArsR family regulator
MNTAGNQEMIRITNQTLILDLIREKGLISRADIAKLLNLSPPSTSGNISRLLEMNMIREVGEGISCGGRKPILIELNKEYGYIVAVDMSCGDIRISLGNICAEVIDGFYF